jgi:hypothetical protein
MHHQFEDQWYVHGLYQLNKIIPVQSVLPSNCSEWLISVLYASLLDAGQS